MQTGQKIMSVLKWSRWAVGAQIREGYLGNIWYKHLKMVKKYRKREGQYEMIDNHCSKARVIKCKRKGANIKFGRALGFVKQGSEESVKQE